MLDYRTTPLEGIKLSPAQLLMGRRPRNILPAAPSIPQAAPYSKKDVKRHFHLEKAKQKYYHDKLAAKELPPLKPGQPVTMAPRPGMKSWLPAVVVEHHISPLSYVVEMRGRKYRRNCNHLHASTSSANRDNWIEPQQVEEHTTSTEESSATL